jgi:SOS-response transcriptional repressor LexA
MNKMQIAIAAGKRRLRVSTTELARISKTHHTTLRDHEKGDPNRSFNQRTYEKLLAAIEMTDAEIEAAQQPELVALDDLPPEAGNANLAFRINSRALDLLGCLPGDTIVIDPHTVPKAGDIVAASVTDETGGRTTILRVMEQPFLLAATTDLQMPRRSILLDSTVRIIGRARRVFRDLAA